MQLQASACRKGLLNSIMADISAYDIASLDNIVLIKPKKRKKVSSPRRLVARAGKRAPSRPEASSSSTKLSP